MKNLKSLLFIAVFALGMSGVANAQKIAHIDFSKVVASMPEMQALNLDLEKMEKTWKDEIQGMEKKLDAKYKKYSAEAKGLSKAINEKRGLEIQDDQKRLAQTKQMAQNDMQQKMNEGLTPIVEKARKAIQEIADSKGIIYVIDSSKGVLLTFEKGEDLFALVKTKLKLIELPKPTAVKK
ncbi:MAG: OmpH family outer membrane protein [Flavobacteriaceae bacterium]